MKTRAIAVFVIAAFVGLIGFDVYLAVDSVGGNTYSEIIRGWGVSFWWLPYLVAGGAGTLVGHWFLNRRTEQSTRARRGILLCAITVLGIIAGALWW